MTENHGYNTPTKGTSDWHKPLNTNFEDIDADIEVRDTAANRGNYTPTSGAKFLATDTGVISVGDGSSWTPTLVLPRYQPSNPTGTIVAGHPANTVSDSALGATISGGGPNDANDLSGTRNEVFGDFGTIGGGAQNTVGDDESVSPAATVGGGANNTASSNSATVGGGSNNTASGASATVSGGTANMASGESSTVSGGISNKASGKRSTVSGGGNNSASGKQSTVSGGINNKASGNYSFAAGRQAKAKANGAFVWADSTVGKVSSEVKDEFRVQSTGGAVFYTSSGDPKTGVKVGAGEGSWSSVSARSAKRNIISVNPDAVLDGVMDLEVSRWEYDTESEATHMGPMAGEFHDAFGLGRDAEHIDNVDADGVALAAIQGLGERVDAQQAKIDEQAERIDDLQAENEQLRSRLEAIEQRLETARAESGVASGD